MGKLLLVRFLILLTLISFVGCGSWSNVRTEIYIDDMETPKYEIRSKSDALVIVEGDKVTVDNRGKESTFSEILKAMFLIRPQVEIE